jgi:hypothetical protein
MQSHWISLFLLFCHLGCLKGLKNTSFNSSSHKVKNFIVISVLGTFCLVHNDRRGPKGL